MARRRKNEEPAAPDGAVDHIERNARRLVTIGPFDAYWSGGEQAAGDVTGAIVRVKPPEKATTEQVNFLVSALEGSGAAAVRVLPPDPGTAKPAQQGEQPAQPTKQSHRELVTAMATAMKSHDSKRLRALCEEVMDEEGL